VPESSSLVRWRKSSSFVCVQATRVGSERSAHVGPGSRRILRFLRLVVRPAACEVRAGVGGGQATVKNPLQVVVCIGPTQTSPLVDAQGQPARRRLCNTAHPPRHGLARTHPPHPSATSAGTRAASHAGRRLPPPLRHRRARRRRARPPRHARPPPAPPAAGRRVHRAAVGEPPPPATGLATSTRWMAPLPRDPHRPDTPPTAAARPARAHGGGRAGGVAQPRAAQTTRAPRRGRGGARAGRWRRAWRRPRRGRRQCPRPPRRVQSRPSSGRAG